MPSEAFKEYANKCEKRYNEWYDVRPLLGNWWAMFYVIVGAREAGKSFSIMNFFLNQWKTNGTPFYWIRLTDVSVKKMLGGKHCEKFVDADLARKYDLDLTKKGDTVYDHGQKMATVLALSEMAKQKGVAYYDNEYEGYYNIMIDEFQREPGEKNTFDIPYNMAGTLENIVRSRKEKVRIFLVANLLEECSDVLANSFNFIPEKFGIYKLKSKRCVIEYIEPTAQYLKRRKGAVANILQGSASNYTNAQEIDRTLIYKGKIYKPKAVIKFRKDKESWFSIWDDNIIVPYKGEKKPIIAMRPYIDEVYQPEVVADMFALYDARKFVFRNLITQKKFERELSLIRSRK